MAMIKVKFHNNINLRTQAQIFKEYTLISTGIAGPGETCILLAESGKYDIYFRNGATGWELARKLDSEAKTVTLSQRKGQYIIR